MNPLSIGCFDSIPKLLGGSVLDDDGFQVIEIVLMDGGQAVLDPVRRIKGGYDDAYFRAIAHG